MNTCFVCGRVIEGSLVWVCDEEEPHPCQIQCRCPECYPGSPMWAIKFPDNLASQLLLKGILIK